MIKPKEGITDYYLLIKKTDEAKLKERRDKDKEPFIVTSK